MAMFKKVAKYQLELLFLAFILGSCERVRRADEANPCGRDVHARAALAHRLLALAALPAAALLLSVRMAVGRAEAAALAAGAKAEGLASVPGLWWCRAALRAQLLLAVALCAASFLFAGAASRYGLRYKTGCAADLAPWILILVPLKALVMVGMVSLHCKYARAAVSSN